jgi:N-acetylglucosamine repressor
MVRSVIKTKHHLVAGLEAQILKSIRAACGLSRVELSRELDLAPSTAGVYVDRLVRDGFLIETKSLSHGYGRRPIVLLPNPDAGRFVGVDFDAHDILAVVVDFSDHSLRRLRRTIGERASLERVLISLEEIVTSAMKGDRFPLLGVGLGVPGRVDSEKGLASDYSFIPDWNEVPIAQRLFQKFGVPVHLENNIRSMALAELWFGQGIGLRNFICVGARTGVGVGAVANGQLLQGAHGAAGSIGKWPIPSALYAERGADVADTLESAVSLKAILEACAVETGRKISFSALQAAIADNNPALCEVIRRAVAIHARALHQLALIFDPSRIIIAGPLAELGPSFVEPLAHMLRTLSIGHAPEIVSSTFGQYGGAFGAAALALQQWKPNRDR